MADKEVGELTDQNFQEALSGEAVAVVDFWAPWCNPCVRFMPHFESASREVEGVAFFKINVEEHTERATELSVQSIPTLILFKSGKMEQRKVGCSTKEELLDFIKAHL